MIYSRERIFFSCDNELKLIKLEGFKHQLKTLRTHALNFYVSKSLFVLAKISQFNTLHTFLKFTEEIYIEKIFLFDVTSSSICELNESRNKNDQFRTKKSKQHRRIYEFQSESRFCVRDKLRALQWLITTRSYKIAGYERY